MEVDEKADARFCHPSINSYVLKSPKICENSQFLIDSKNGRRERYKGAVYEIWFESNQSKPRYRLCEVSIGRKNEEEDGCFTSPNRQNCEIHNFGSNLNFDTR